jgi:hypothetical protein
MKDFFGDERIQKTLQPIDWGVRRIQLCASEGDSSGKVVVTRALQVRALRPHIFLQKNVSDAEAADSDTEMTTSDGETAASDGGPLKNSSRPKLRFAIGHADAAWTASLLTYISFYRFEGVLWLFDAFGRGIRPSSDAYRGFLAQMRDQVYATRPANPVKITYH